LVVDEVEQSLLVNVEQSLLVDVEHSVDMLEIGGRSEGDRWWRSVGDRWWRSVGGGEIRALRLVGSGEIGEKKKE
ncbi:hypothetical protein Tco_1152169, partial [Tanacetum coccineum]